MDPVPIGFTERTRLDGIRAIAIVLVAAGVAALATPLVMRFALAVGAVDRPTERKVSRRERMPLLGGLAVAMGCVAGLLLSTVWSGGPEIWPKAMGFLIGAFTIVGFESAATVLKVNEAIDAGRRLSFQPEEFKA